MKVLRVLIAALVLSSMGWVATADEVQDVREVVLNFHLRRTQPFYRGRAIVAQEPRGAQPGDRPWFVAGVEGHAFDERDLRPARVERSRAMYSVVDLASYRTSAAYDWTRIALAFPAAAVVYELSDPRFYDAHEYAVVRLDGTSLNEPQTRSSTALYRLHRADHDGWVIVGLIAPCCP